MPHDPKGLALGLGELLRIWPEMPPTLQLLLPGLPGLLKETVECLESVEPPEERPSFADKAENPTLATAVGLANCIDESDSAEAQDLADLVRKIPRRPKPVFSMDYIAEALRDGKVTDLRFEVRFCDYRDITHVSWLQNTVVLRQGVCPCKCHTGHGLIMHDVPCCSPITPFTYPSQSRPSEG